MFESIIADYGGEEVSAIEVYTNIFRLGEHEIQNNGEPSGGYKTNPIGYYKNKNEEHGHFRIFFDDTFPETLKELQEADFAILNGLTYFGRKNLMANANRMFAMIFDLDGVTGKTLNNFLSGAYRAKIYPIPNYIILSGHGVHLYYLLENPVPLYPNIKLQLKNLKYALTDRMWNEVTSTERRKQYQGINQGFRIIGGKTKIDGVRVRAFKLHDHPFCLAQFNEFVSIDSNAAIDENKLYRESKMTLAEAKEKYPEWYQKRVLDHEPKGHWTCKEDLYKWWLRKIETDASYHHRYFTIMCLAIYGVKCGIPFEQVERDTINLIPFLDSVNPSEPFTEADARSALECYDERYFTFPRKDIEKLANIVIPPNKRNGRKREDHLIFIRGIKALKKQLGEDVDGGRPSKEMIVKEWRSAHPEGRKVDCIKETGLAKGTVYKWWE